MLFRSRTRPDVVFHLAAQIDVRVSVARPVEDALVNVVGSLNVFEAALAAGVRKVVFAGSGGTLYGSPSVIPTPESEPQRPESPYGVAKKAVGDYLHYYREVRGLDSTVLALANVYGPRQDPHGEAGVVAIFTERMLRGEPVTIFGDGNQQRDYVYVADVVEAAIRGATRTPATCLVGTGLGTSTQSIFDTLAALTGYETPVRYGPERPGDIQRIWLDASRAREVWGWSAEVPFAEGMARTVEWFRERAES